MLVTLCPPSLSAVGSCQVLCAWLTVRCSFRGDAAGRTHGSATDGERSRGRNTSQPAATPPSNTPIVTTAAARLFKLVLAYWRVRTGAGTRHAMLR